MAHSADSTLTPLCRKRLERFIQQSFHVQLPLAFPRALAEITRIVDNNTSNGRFERLSQHRRTEPKLSRSLYVDLVISYWVLEYERLHRLESRNTTEWQQQYSFLVHSAKRMLQRYPQNSVARGPEDLALWACEKIYYEGSYPFDVPFPAWAVTILKNQVLASSRSKDALDKPHDLIQVADYDPEIEGDRFAHAIEVPDAVANRDYKRIEDRDALDRAIRKLNSPDQRKIIRLTFFEGLDDAAIARQLGKSIGAIQTTKSRALDNLSRILLD
jgi:RNA polymerase sigma factor (sigma-70 family)